MDNVVFKYFNLSKDQKRKINMMMDIYSFWNNKVNLISRKDLVHFYERHVLHSLSICKYFEFNHNAKIMDLGTGGGFPGVPLAIMFPNVNFYLVDSITKKTRVINDIIKEIGLNNVIIINDRAENIDQTFDFIVSRAVAKLNQIKVWTKDKISKNHQHSCNNGWICLKGGNVLNEVKDDNHIIYSLSDSFEENFFIEKKIIYVANN